MLFLTIISYFLLNTDLKPENILLTFDKEKGKCLDLKLCDFGLSTVFNSTSILTDFCGSPGMFFIFILWNLSS